MMVHWQGEDHTELYVKKNKRGHHRWSAQPEIEPLIRALARQLPDKAIASLLNRLGKVTGRQNGWTQSRVCSFRNTHNIAVYIHGERGEYTLQEAAGMLGVRPMTLLRMIRAGYLLAKQYCKGTPWVIHKEDMERPDVQHYAKAGIQHPLSKKENQQIEIFQ